MGNRVPTFSFTLHGHHPRAICQALDAAGISAWDGNYYAPEVTRRLGLEESGGMVRVGAVHYNTLEEVKQRNDPKEEILRSNMECNGYDQIIVNTNSWKVTLPLEAGDTVLDFVK